jgi:hypothetical protein
MRIAANTLTIAHAALMSHARQFTATNISQQLSSTLGLRPVAALPKDPFAQMHHNGQSI